MVTVVVSVAGTGTGTVVFGRVVVIVMVVGGRDQGRRRGFSSCASF